MGKSVIRKTIMALNSFEPTREYLMVPLIFVRDKLRDLKSFSIIKNGRVSISNYKDIHKGQRCFVIGNGPSLTPEDLNLIKNEICFGSNRIYDIYEYTEWGPTYYAIQDFNVLQEISLEVEERETRSNHRFIAGNRSTYICKEMMEDQKNSFFYLGSCLSEKRKIQFTEDMQRTVASGRTVTYMMIQMAYYMGFKEIYLLGVDHSYGQYLDKEGNLDTEIHAQSHFKGARAYKHLKGYNYIAKNPLNASTKAYQKAEDYSRNHGFRIYNCTRGGKLEVFERRTLENVLKEKRI